MLDCRVDRKPLMGSIYLFIYLDFYYTVQLYNSKSYTYKIQSNRCKRHRKGWLLTTGLEFIYTILFENETKRLKDYSHVEREMSGPRSFWHTSVGKVKPVGWMTFLGGDMRMGFVLRNVLSHSRLKSWIEVTRNLTRFS